MKKIRFYSENEAQKRMNEDFNKIYDLLNPYVQEYRGKSLGDTSFSEVVYKKLQNKLPDGWILDANSSNAFIVRIGDGENEEKPFFAPSIFVDFEHTEAKDCCEFKKSIIKRFPVGYCNCGNPIKPMLDLMNLEKQAEKGGINFIFAWMKGNFWYPIKFKKYPYWDLQVSFNRCDKCL